MPSYKALFNQYGDQPRQKQPMQMDALKAAQSSMQPRTPTSNNAMQGIGASVTAMQRAQQLATPKAQAYRLAAAQTKGQGPTLAPGGPGGSVYNPIGEQQMPPEVLQQRSAFSFPEPPTDKLPLNEYAGQEPHLPSFLDKEYTPPSPYGAPASMGPTSPREDSPFDPLAGTDTPDIIEEWARQQFSGPRDLEEETAYLETMGDRNLGQALADARGRWGAMGLGGAGMAGEGDLATQMALATSGKVFDLEQAARDEALRNALGASSIYEGTRRGNLADEAFNMGADLIYPDRHDVPPTREEALAEAERQMELMAELSERIARGEFGDDETTPYWKPGGEGQRETLLDLKSYGWPA